MLTALLIATASAQQAPCAFTARSAELRAKLDEAESAYREVDVDGFSSAMDEVAMMVPCVSDRLTKEEAARLHRMYGIQSFANGDERKAKVALSAAARTEPTWRVPPGLLPASHPITLIYNAVEPTPDPRVAVAQAIDGDIRFDGELEVGRPTTRSTIFQLLDADGDALKTVYLWPDSELPDYAIDPTVAAIPAEKTPVTPPEKPTPLPSEPIPDQGANKKTGGLVTSVAFLGLGAITAGAALAQNPLMKEADNRDQLDGIFARQVAFGVISYASLGTGTVLGVRWVAKKK